MTDETTGGEVPEDEGIPSAQDLGELLQKAIESVDLDAAAEQAKRLADLQRKFPEHAKMAMFEREMQMLHVFLQHYLPTKGLMIATRDGEPYQEDPEGPFLLTEFFGVDADKFNAEVPGLQALAHQQESEYEAEHLDPELAAQMAEFEAMLADMDDQMLDIPEEDFR